MTTPSEWRNAHLLLRPASLGPRHEMDDDFPHPPRLTLPSRGQIPPAPQVGTLTIVDIASSGTALAAWVEAARAAAIPVAICRLPSPEPAAWWQGRHATFEAVAAGRHVGWRLAITGPEYAVMALQAVALKSGLLPEEVLVHAEPAPLRCIYCAHCTTVSVVDAREPIECTACGRTLAIHEHFNPTGGYFLASVTGQP